MDVAYNVVGGISEQNLCCLHPIEAQCIEHWASTYCLTPYPYEPVNIWNAYWFSRAGDQVKRRKMFESSYGFEFRQEVDPTSGQLIDVIAIGNTDYFDYVCEIFYGSGPECGDCTFPTW